MRIRRRATLVCTFEGERLAVHDFLEQAMFEAGHTVIAAMRALQDWQEMDEALASVTRETGDAGKAAELIEDLLASGLLIVEGSPEAERDQRYRDCWRWGAVAGFFQFGMRDQEFLEGEQVEDRMVEYQQEGDAPKVLTTHEGLEKRIPLPAFDLENSFFRELHARRSNREYSGDSIPLDKLADCLYAANGVKEVNDHGAFGILPKAMTPSGGARNPHELYIYARSVDGLEPGFYHYSSLDHELGFLHATELPDPADLLGRQSWTNDAAAIVFLAATFERTAWKYRQPLAYRVVLMETGYIGQNLLLTASHHGLAAAPTGALAESRIESLLGLDGIGDAVIFALVLGDPSAEGDTA